MKDSGSEYEYGTITKGMLQIIEEKGFATLI